MRLNYKKIGGYLRKVEERNIEDKKDNLLGVSVSKIFMPSIANTVGTDFTTYRVVKQNQFTYIPDTSRRGDKIAIALLDNNSEGLVSQAYTVFEIVDQDKLDPEYLMMWFRRTEFDRYARFISHGSVREIFEWEDMCNVSLPMPPINKQRETVAEYNIIQNSIRLNELLIQKLEETAQVIYKRWFLDFEFPDNKGTPYKSSGGEMVWNDVLKKEVPAGWSLCKLKKLCQKIGSGSTPTGGKNSYSSFGISLIRSTNVLDYTFSYSDLAFITDQQASKLRHVEVLEKDLLFNITGVSVARCCMVPENVIPARVSQHVMIIRTFKDLNVSFYLLLNLCSTESKNTLLGISQSGSTREAITKSEIEDFEILLPHSSVLHKFDPLIEKLFHLKDIKSKECKKLHELKELLLAKLATN
jgi:type I restriction enzyme S subunit